jgi:hypothetical protein
MNLRMMALATVMLVMSSACSKSSLPRPKEQRTATALDKQTSERNRLDSFYATRELECAKKRDEAAFLKANGRHAGVAEDAAKVCY